MISVITGAIGIAVAAAIIMLIRKDRMHVRHGMGWLVVALGFALLGFSPSIIDKLAGAVGVAYPPVLALTVAIAVLVIKILLMDIERANMEIRRLRLIQRVAMLEAELKVIQSKLGDRKENDTTQ